MVSAEAEVEAEVVDSAEAEVEAEAVAGEMVLDRAGAATSIVTTTAWVEPPSRDPVTGEAAAARVTRRCASPPKAVPALRRRPCGSRVRPASAAETSEAIRRPEPTEPRVESAKAAAVVAAEVAATVVVVVAPVAAVAAVAAAVLAGAAAVAAAEVVEAAAVAREAAASPSDNLAISPPGLRYLRSTGTRAYRCTTRTADPGRPSGFSEARLGRDKPLADARTYIR